jgi:uncharacterized membrane protein
VSQNKNILIPITIIGWSLWSIFNKLALQKLHPFYVGLVASCISVCFIPIYTLLLKNNVDGNLTIQPIGIMWVILASIASTVASLVFLFGIRTGDVGTISVLSCTHPALTFILATIIFHEQITLLKVIGIILIIFGSVILAR